jgi:hypothetical protein
MIKQLFVAVIAVLLVGARANAFETVESLAEAVVAAAQAKSEEAQVALYHPDYLASLSETERKRLHFVLARERELEIGGESEIVTEMRPLFAGPRMRWPVRPEATFRVQDRTGETVILGFAARKDDRWYRVYHSGRAEPPPVAETLPPLREVVDLLETIERERGAPGRMPGANQRAPEADLAVELAHEVLRLRREMASIQQELAALRSRPEETRSVRQ